jgi:hypothetical protein
VPLQVFAYGQAGSGKTSALGMGRIFAGGLFQKTITAVWQALDVLQSVATLTMEVTFVELHNNTIRDLLSEKVPLGRLRECPINGPYLENVTCAPRSPKPCVGPHCGCHRLAAAVLDSCRTALPRRSRTRQARIRRSQQLRIQWYDSACSSCMGVWMFQ